MDEVLRWENKRNFTKKLNVEMRTEFRNDIYPELVYVLTGHGLFRAFLNKIG